ncbi:very short patch repair endonuclease [Planotetraspora phitsanulokensis]|uniref:very short patch repair endonuclease n=1 Tax=Planotetraspora phitsanulokensis TaxID=575192 RepID=UPI0019512C82
MQSNKGRDTRPELALRRAVHALGLRYRVCTRPLPGVGTADLVFTRARLAVFLDGCFWHGCPTHHTVAKTNSDFWARKLRINRENDQKTNRLLQEAGWGVLRIWEHEDPGEAARLVQEAYRHRFESAHDTQGLSDSADHQRSGGLVGSDRERGEARTYDVDA